ncbi:hypothetical protein PsorP6_001341 [Peronosclerospora sorghi]|uniref:Uncharacterized protein n=1 Tax=Peronosclerospora sorghi TaxID=230839 RepID=A0ACC0WSQ5_9STRA|nr:hypothetical protein PsorP6_001341 [Peronosclerospora sorghi]
MNFTDPVFSNGCNCVKEWSLLILFGLLLSRFDFTTATSFDSGRSFLRVCSNIVEWYMRPIKIFCNGHRLQVGGNTIISGFIWGHLGDEVNTFNTANRCHKSIVNERGLCECTSMVNVIYYPLLKGFCVFACGKNFIVQSRMGR